MKHDIFKHDTSTIQVWDDMGEFAINVENLGSFTGYLPKSDAPALALAILKAAGVNQHEVEDAYLAGAYNSLAHYLKRREIDEVAAALTKRRDELAKELNGGGIDAAHDTYAGQPMPIRTAIDRIIELEPQS